jgi:hypothetical protein
VVTEPPLVDGRAGSSNAGGRCCACRLPAVRAECQRGHRPLGAAGSAAVGCRRRGCVGLPRGEPAVGPCAAVPGGRGHPPRRTRRAVRRSVGRLQKRAPPSVIAARSHPQGIAAGGIRQTDRWPPWSLPDALRVACREEQRRGVALRRRETGRGPCLRVSPGGRVTAPRAGRGATSPSTYRGEAWSDAAADVQRSIAGNRAGER